MQLCNPLGRRPFRNPGIVSWLVSVIAMLMLTLSPSSAQTYDAAKDFSTASNPNGVWSYGWSATLGGSFNRSPTTVSPCGNGLIGWTDTNAAGYILKNVSGQVLNGPCGTGETWQPDELGIQAGPSNQICIVRFTAPADGTYNVQAAFSYIDPNATITGYVLKNGAVIFSGSIGSNYSNAALQLSAGDTLDFACDWGTDNSFSGDRTGLAVTIQANPSGPPPSPQKWNLFWQNTTTHDATVWYMNGGLYTGQWDWVARQIPASWTISAAADLLQNGETQLLWRNSQSGDLTVWYMKGVKYTGQWDYIARNVPLVWKLAGVADLNSDGKPDLIWQNTSTGDVTVWYMNGTAWTGKWDYLAKGVSLDWKIVGTGDFNSDGKPDLVWQNSATRDVMVWYMKGAVWSGKWDLLAWGVLPGWRVAAIADLNGDKQPDLVWQNDLSGEIAYYLMRGAVWFEADDIAFNVPTVWKIVRKH